MAIEGANVDETLLLTEAASSSGAGAERGHGHFFTKKTFAKPSYCHSCCDMIWGMFSTGYTCEVCNYTCHEKCLDKVFSYCSGVAMQLIKNPVAHSWSERGRLEKKFCCVCRKRCEEKECFECEVCDYFVHGDCRDLAVSDCKEAATGAVSSAAAAAPSAPIHHHHWREGNLPSGTKCSVCRKSCASSETLSGMRCQWCQTCAHASCYKQVQPSECHFGDLRKIILPPSALTIPRTELPMKQLLRIRPPPKDAATPSQQAGGTGGKDPDSNGPSTPPNPPLEGADAKEKDDQELVRIYDGNAAFEAGSFRSFSVGKSSSLAVVRDAALRTFHIAQPPANYCLTLLTSTEPLVEEPLKDPQPLKDLGSKDGRRLQLFLRYHDPNPAQVTIRVHGGWLRIPVTFCSIPIGPETQAQELVALALKRLGLQSHSAESYNLVLVSLDKGVAEQTVEPEERVMELVERLRTESLREWHLQRLYLQEKEDPHGATVSVFIGNLPKNLNQRQYERILIRLLGEERPFTAIGPIYYEYGSLVVTFNSPKAATKAVIRLSASTYDDKTLLVLCLPNIQVEALADDAEPLMVLVNVKSGGGERGGQGWDLIRSFRKLLNPFQVFDVINGGPLVGLYVFRKVEKYRILVCGGDGTVGWVLQCLDNAKQDAACFSPPCGIVPLGTGNDLARVLNWGGGHTGQEDSMQILKDTMEAEEIRLDRWTVVFREEEQSEMPTRHGSDNDPGEMTNPEDQSCMIIMNNYFGIGIDASVCLDFHIKRMKHPNRFSNRIVNKGYYGLVGMQKMLAPKHDCRNLHKMIQLDVNGRHIDLPAIEGIIILNIMSWGSGANIWGLDKAAEKDSFRKPTHHDGLLEVVGVKGVMHLGNMQQGIQHGIRIAQGDHIRITTNEKLAVQVDGEPHLQAAGTITILKTPLYATMLKKKKTRKKEEKEARKGGSAAGQRQGSGPENRLPSSGGGPSDTPQPSQPLYFGDPKALQPSQPSTSAASDPSSSHAPPPPLQPILPDHQHDDFV